MHQKSRKLSFQADEVSKPAPRLHAVRAELRAWTGSGVETGSKINLGAPHVQWSS